MARAEQDLSQLLQDGFDALNRGQLEVAAKACQNALSQRPDLAPAHFLVGLVALEGEKRQVAHNAFKSVVKIDRDHAAAWAQIARLNASEGRIALAEAALKEVRRIQPTDPAVLDLTGTVLNQLGEYETAKAFFTRVNEQAPGKTGYMMNLANALVFNGDIEEAVELFRAVIDLDPRSAQSHWGLANAVKAADDQHILQMQQLIDTCSANPRARGFLYYAIGKEYEDLQQWQAAFDAFTAGAAARRETVEFDEVAEEAMFDLIRTRFDAAWLAKRPGGNPDPSPIFVLGQPRTGTTLIERVITSHSQVHSAGELQQFGLATRRVSQHIDHRRFSSGLFAAAADADPKAIGDRYLQTSARMRGKTPRFVDKLPVNYLHLPLILAALPNARIVHLVRGPMDACFASFKQLFADAYLHSYEQKEMARHHIRYRRLMDHYRAEFPDRFIDIRYEDAARDLEPHARSLIAALGLNWEDACLNFHESSAGVATASAVQVREPAHTRSIGRWKRYESQLAPMCEELARASVPFD
ncbi:MAG: sulfotransferase [Proteobacteria bacterium]|nr:sulfotransferase [Pseudomonadota bacterium]